MRPLALVASLALVATPLIAATAPSAVAPWAGSVAVIGDFGSASKAEADVARLVATAQPVAVVTVGDNVYSSAGYPALVGAYYPRWATAHLLFPATGNHDYAEGANPWTYPNQCLPTRQPQGRPSRHRRGASGRGWHAHTGTDHARKRRLTPP